MNKQEQWVIEAAKNLVDRWVEHQQLQQVHEDAESAAITDKQSLAGLMVDSLTLSESVARAKTAEVELIHAVIQLEGLKAEL